jgi:hypothetical protein
VEDKGMRRINIILMIGFIIMCMASAAFGQPDMKANICVSGSGAMDCFVIGMQGDATNGFDNAFDTISPGAGFNDTYILTYMDHPEWGQIKQEFKGDIRSLKAQDEWTVSVYTKNLPAGTGLVLKLLENSVIPSGYTLKVEDTDLTAAGYQFSVTTPDAIRNIKVASTYTSTVTAPGAPVIGTAKAGNAQASVTFTAPVSDGGSAILDYTVTSSPGGKTATGTTSPIKVLGLTNGRAYTFTVTARNAVGSGPPSAASNSVRPARKGGR